MMNQSQAEFRRKGENPFSLEPVNAVRQISSFLLLGQAKCLHIEHDGLVYQLRITKLGKLVLTK
jgi:hemin uptake protein HemP